MVSGASVATFDFNQAQIYSIGLRSGEYGERKDGAEKYLFK